MSCCDKAEDKCICANKDMTERFREKDDVTGKYIDLTNGVSKLTLKASNRFSLPVIKQYIGVAITPTPDGFDGGWVTFTLPRADNIEIVKDHGETRTLFGEVRHVDNITGISSVPYVRNFVYTNGADDS